jgi:protoporphyrinogen oxidase
MNKSTIIMDKHHDFIIIGAGISGLSFAHYCRQQNFTTLVLEQNAQTGGSVHSHHFAPCGQFWLELGTHSCFNSYGQLLKLLQHYQLSQQLVPKKTGLYPIWTAHQLKSVLSQLSWPALLRAMPRLFNSQKAGKTVRQYYSQVLGEKNYRQLFGAAFSAVACQSVDELPADILFKKKPRDKSVAKNFTLANGLQTITDTLAQQSGALVLTNSSVQTIQPQAQGYALSINHQGEQQTLQCRHLVLATPVQIAAQLLQFAPDLSNLLKQIRYVSVESMGVCIAKEAISLKPLAGIIAHDDVFYSVVARDYIVDEAWRGFTFHFKPLGLSVAQKRQKIAQVLGVSEQNLAHWVEKTNHLPSPKLNHSALISQVDALLASQPLGLIGNYFNGFSVEDCLLRSHQEFRRLTA